MRFLNSIRLLMANFRHVYKLLLYKVIITLVASALCCAFLLPELIGFWESPAVQALYQDGKEFFRAFMELSKTGMDVAKNEIVGANGSLRQVGLLISSMRLEIVLVCVGLAVVYVLKRFADTVCYFTTGSMLNDKMATYAEARFATSSIANLGKASLYSLVYVPITFLFDVALLVLAYLILSFLPILPAVFSAVTLIVLGQALKLALTVNWMPAMTTDNMRLRDAMRSKGKEGAKQFAKAFSTYIVMVYAIMILNVLAIFCTFGSALLITVPLSYFLLICLQYVHYYTTNGKKYFLTYENIAKNTGRGDDEHFFEYLEEAESVQETQETQEAKEMKENVAETKDAEE